MQHILMPLVHCCQVDGFSLKLIFVQFSVKTATTNKKDLYVPKMPSHKNL